MSDSMKEQLVKLGLVKPGRKPRGSGGSNQQAKKHGGARGKPVGSAELSLDQAYRLRKKEEKETAESMGQKKRADDLLRKQVNSKIQAIVDQHALNDKSAAIKRSFLYKGRIRSVLVTAQQIKWLNKDRLGVVFLRGSYFLLEPAIVEQVRAISTDHVPDLASGGDSDLDGDHPVPDDLVW